MPKKNSAPKPIAREISVSAHTIAVIVRAAAGASGSAVPSAGSFCQKAPIQILSMLTSVSTEATSAATTSQ